MKALVKKLARIQRDLKAPKNQFNSFGKYRFRSCEDILEGVKPLLGGLALTVNDDIQLIGDRVYVKATASLTDGEHTIDNSAFAREPQSKKGMDDSQVTGTASSYARKYALNGLFCIDDTKDADHESNHQSNQSQEPEKPWYNAFDQEKKRIKAAIANGMTPDAVIVQLEQTMRVNNKIKDEIRGMA
jgi:hypothetical protein